MVSQKDILLVSCFMPFTKLGISKCQRTSQQHCWRHNYFWTHSPQLSTVFFHHWTCVSKLLSVLYIH